MGGNERVVLLRLANALQHLLAVHRVADVEIGVLAVDANHRVWRQRARIGAQSRDVIRRNALRRALARGVAVVCPQPPPAAGEIAAPRSHGGKTAVDSDAEAGTWSGTSTCAGKVARIKVIALLGNDDRIGRAVDAGCHAVALIRAEHSAPRLLRLRGRAGTDVLRR